MSRKHHLITLQPSGTTLEVGEDQTVLEVALDEGVHLPYGCRGGSCGSCRGRVTSGQFEYHFGQRPPGISAEDHAAGHALLCLTEPLSDMQIEISEVRTADTVEIKRLPARVERLQRLADDVMALHLRLPAVERLPFRAGQYLDVILRDGRRRSFSIANPPHDDATIELHVRAVTGGEFTGEVFGGMQEKTLLRVEAPLGCFALREERDEPIIMVAGGTGFAPIKSMIRHALHTHLGRPIRFYWGARREADLYEHDLVRSWAASYSDLDYIPVLSDAEWSGRTGWVHEAVLADHPELSGFEVYAAGPPPMTDAIRASFMAAGLREDHLHCDAFDFAAETQAAIDAAG